jgi:hypothetical protein
MVLTDTKQLRQPPIGRWLEFSWEEYTKKNLVTLDVKGGVKPDQWGGVKVGQ